MSAWNQAEAIALCRQIEEVCPRFGCHVALTGGLLYKTGSRKDADILFYKIRQAEAIDREGLFSAMENFGVSRGSRFGWVEKATWQGRAIDFFFPETASNHEYANEEASESLHEAEDDRFPF